MNHHVHPDRYAYETDVSKVSSFRKTVFKIEQDYAAQDARYSLN